MKEPVAVCIMGPTASGKSQLAIELAREIPAEIISVDSALVYSGLDIGTAKPSRSLLDEIPHHLIDIRDPSVPYSAAEFRADATRCVYEIHARGNIPLLTGDTMLYFKALKDGLADLPAANNEIRDEIADLAVREGWAAVHQQLKAVDPVAAARINPNDPQRLQRALEVYRVSGRSLTDWQQQETTGCPFDLLEIAVVPTDRQGLHKKIEIRFRQMLTEGFLDEVSRLYDRGDLSMDLPAIKAVGYRQAWSYLKGDIDHETMVQQALAATRQLAKRQFTWLRSWQDLRQLEYPSRAEALKILKADSILG